MRTLLLLRGVPGVGKSTFIKNNHLEPYTLCADDFRLKICNPVLNTTGKVEINQNNDGEAWRLLYAALEYRMKRGDFTIIDATNCSPTMVKQYKKMSDMYRYSVYYLDFDCTLEQALERNRQREEYKFVPEDAIKRMYAMYKSLKPQAYVKKIDSIEDILNYYTVDLTDKYKRVVVIGDVHGCYTVLKQALEEGLKEDTKYVFVGDLLDRGLENKEVLDFWMKHYTDSNVTFIMGNHEDILYKWATDSLERDKKGNVRILSATKKTVETFISGMSNTEVEEFKQKIRMVLKKTTQCFSFKFNDNKYFVNHGGLTALPKMTFIPTVQMVKGVGSYNFDVDSVWENSYREGKTQGFIQIHGHRMSNEFDISTYDGTEHSVNLEGSVERGGDLKVCEITGNSYVVKRYKNTVFDDSLNEVDTPEHAYKMKGIVTENPITNETINDKYVCVKDMGENGHNLISLNFTEKAFYKGVWNKNTIRARGLFVDKTTGEVKMRSYNKFFNLGERKEDSREELNKTLKFPLKVYRKQNGFLGIMSVVDGDMILASKSTLNSSYADMFKEIFYTLNYKEIEALKSACVEYNCSFVFEVCHVNDKHIIDFDKNHLWLLDAIPNKYDIGGIDINEKFSEEVKSQIPIISGIMQKKVLLFEANSVEEVEGYAKFRHHDRDIEGVVCQDRNGYMFKLKFHYYRVVKKLRGDLHVAQRMCKYNGMKWGAFRSEREIKFISFFVKKPIKEWENINIIDAVKMYEKENEPIMSLEN